ncbi:YchJ family protein [Isoalcanivorax pacificus]|nr:YchJ family protein [Isoalcanivorax pacificus]
MTDPLHAAPCPCCSGTSYGNCCAPLHAGQPASSPEALMRSRYSAFVLGDNAYLLQSWHPDTRPETLTLDAGVRWRRLEILGAPAAGAAATEGTVRFVATQQQGNQWHQLTELSRFTRIGQHWLYRDGDAGMRRLDPGRNSPCPCGRGRKFKHCCG